MKRVDIAGSILASISFCAACAERDVVTAPSDAIAFEATAGMTSAITDALGDVKNKAPIWLDLTVASITRADGRFVFQWDVAAAVPANPTLDPAVPAHSDHVCIGTGLEADPTTAPVGYPFGKNEENFAEFYVAICWNPTGSFGLGTGFVGFLVDRRPLLSGQSALVVPIEARVDGKHLAVSLDADALGDPSVFSWIAFTEVANQTDPNDAAWFPDFAPDGSLATWPR